jgi:hypothetical protein
VTPLDKVRGLYTAQSPRTFAEDLTAHMQHGYVFSTPEYLMMARPVWTQMTQEAINDVWCNPPQPLWNAWYIYAFALREDQGLQGLVKNLLTHMPFYLPLVAWERTGHALTFFSTDKLLHKYAKLPSVPA